MNRAIFDEQIDFSPDIRGGTGERVPAGERMTDANHPKDRPQNSAYSAA
jgi:hypothetical protein